MRILHPPKPPVGSLELDILGFKKVQGLGFFGVRVRNLGLRGSGLGSNRRAVYFH